MPNKTSTVKIVKDPGNPQPIEIMEKAIRDAAEGARKLLGSKLTKRAIMVLIKDSISSHIGLKEIETILDCAATLDARYLKQEKK